MIQESRTNLYYTYFASRLLFATTNFKTNKFLISSDFRCNAGKIGIKKFKINEINFSFTSANIFLELDVGPTWACMWLYRSTYVFDHQIVKTCAEIATY